MCVLPYSLGPPAVNLMRAVHDLIDPDVYKNKFLENWALMTTIRKPIIAAVSGYAVWHWTLSLNEQH